MPARLIAVDGKTVTLELTLELSRSLLETEERILAVLNEAGCVATQEALKQLDTDGSPLMIGAVKLTSINSVMSIPLLPSALTDAESLSPWSARWSVLRAMRQVRAASLPLITAMLAPLPRYRCAPAAQCSTSL